VLVYLSRNIAVSVLRARRAASFQALGTVFMPSER